MKKLLAILLSAVILCLCLTACGGNNATDGNATNGNASESDEEKILAFAEFESTDMQGNTVDENIFKGNKLTVVNIWATFCSPCINEMPDLEKISKEYADKGVKFIGICCDIYLNDADGTPDKEKLEKAESIIKETGVTYTNIIPSPTLNDIKLDSVVSVPETIFIDEDGNVLATYVGSNSYEVWCSRIDEFIA